MAFSKVTLNGTTLMDVTQDTVNESNLLDGETATKANGVRTTGTVVTADVDDTLSVAGDAADAKATGDAVADLRNAIEQFEDGKVHITGYDIIPNEYPASNGTFPSYNNWQRSDYIEIPGGQNIYFEGLGGTSSDQDNAWYDSTHTIISRFTINVGDDIVLAPSNAKYMVISTKPDRWWSDIYIYGARGLPSPPTSNGTYTLRCVVSNGTPTYSWVSV